MGHPCRPAALFNLATAKFVNCKANGTRPGLGVSITLFQGTLELRPADHPDRTITQLHLAIALLSHFAKMGFQTDADAAEELLSEVLDVCHASSNDEDLDEAIALQTEALALCPVGHTDRSMTLYSLVYQLSIRFEHRGNDEDLDQAIACYREVLALCLVGHTDWPMHRGNNEDLEALALRPVGHADRFLTLNNLATKLASHFEHQGNDEDLDQAIALHREVLALHPVGHTDWSMSLHNLANQLSSHFEHRGNDEDLDQAIALQTEALALRPVGHADQFMPLNNLANSLSIRFEHRGNDEDLDQAIALQREVLALRPVGHADRSSSLNDLANQLSSRFYHRGNDEDLNQAIALHMEALALHPIGHADRSISLHNLANQLSSRFERRGNDEDLDQAIALQTEALALCPVANLATQLSDRFHHRGNDEDLDQAIALQTEVLALFPVGHTGWPQLSTHFEHRGNDEDLDQAITFHREALALRPVGHTDRSLSLNNLANQLSSRFDHRGNDEDLDQAIALQTETLALRPVGHPHRSSSLNNLVNQLSSHFDHRGNDEDLDQAIALHMEVLALHPIGHADRSMSLHNLTNEFSNRFDHRGNDEDLDQAIALQTEALALYPVGLLPRLRASLSWVRQARQHSHGTELEACTTSMQLLDTYMSTTASVSSRHNVMKDFPSTLAVDAASCALRSGDVCRAVELLEQGRTIIWTQMTQLRTPLDTLKTRSDHAAALVKKFRDLSSLLDKPPANYPEATSRVDVEAEAEAEAEAEDTRYRRLVKDWNRAVEEIRKIEGFSSFLLPPLFSNLQDAARDGPIIVLIASQSSCDAIIIPHKQPPTSIQLPISLLKLARLVVALREAINKEAGPKGNQPALTKALRELWGNVVRPNLAEFAPRGSRIWWCPTSFFNFLPLHAAGKYRANGESLSQQYVSSYTPSLTALMRAHRSHDRSPSVSFAAIGQNLPAGALFTLDGVEPELELVQSLLPPPPTVSFTKITSVEATKSRALWALQDNTWLHFACHGTQEFDEPFKSAFLMRDHPLSLLDITQMDLSRHQFAFLSACETAVGAFSTPDEVIHLAAGLQFAGVKSVVGTLWKVNDNTVQRLVKAFYKNLCGDGKMNSKRAAQALHQAVHSLACDKDMPLEQRIVFMHIGI
ncbi:TPR-like protein [Suillus subalutaceus]|uniref:TPR-like protein n=1 Tax=Suillus subalutaceus TaxID=48586 RepID=UPI001B86B95B|nr:TPR-like protein [Suillus subalutaceus]KAG1842265.1 TPR-like protein [Suillus subalutaceus]